MKNKKLYAISVFVLIVIILSSFFVYAKSSDSYRPYLHKASVPESPAFELPGVYKTELFPGAATYSYDIKIPPGVNGLTPQVKIVYNSQRTFERPGILGSAWTTNINYIQRDVYYSSTQTSDDRFILVLNGESHKLVYDSSTSRYHTEVESFLRIEKKTGGINQKKEYWIVTATDGTQYRFGYNLDSESVSNINSYGWRWHLDLITNTDGNNIYYTYKENPNSGDLGATYPIKIEYNNDKKRTIEFIYESTDTPYKYLVYEQGNKVTISRKLNYINVKANNNLVRKYDIDYTTNGFLSLVSKITEYGSDGYTTLPPAQFSYNSLNTGWSYSSTYEPPSSAAFADYVDGYDEGVRLADVNGDGLVDILKKKDCSSSNCRGAWLNTGSGWSYSSQFEPPYGAEFVEIYAPNYGDYISEDQGVRLADLNGDGFTDILKADDCSSSSCRGAWLNTGSGWMPAPQFKPPYDAEFVDNGEDQGVRIIDLNGDGRADLIKNLDCSSSSCRGAWLNTGNGWQQAPNYKPPYKALFSDNSDGYDEGTRVADLNGDKLDDLIKRADWGGSDGRGAWLNTGSGWAYSTSFEPPSSAMFVKRDSSGSKTIGVDQGVRVVDINGDGRSDLIERKDKSGSDYRGAWLNTGSGWLYSSSFEPPSSAAFVDSKGENEGMKIGDANGDGISDLLKRSDGSGSNYRGAWLNNAAKAFLLKQVKTPAGATIDIEYEKSTAYDNTGSDSKSDLPFNINVVKKISENNGVSGTQNSKGVYSYSYKNGFYDSGYADQEFRGFGNVEETKPDTSKVHHWFYQDDAKKGKEYKTEIYDSGKNLYKRTEITWNSKKKNNYYIVTLDKVKDSTFDGKGSYPKVQEISYTYDSYNNPIFISDNGEANHYADEKYQYYDYVYNTNKWIIGKPKTYTLKQSKTGSKQKETRYSYDNLAYGASPTKGKLTKKEEWITGIKYSIKKYQHNSYGNLIKETDPRGYSTSFDYDSTYTYPTKITNAKNQATSNTYDLGTGNLLTTIDPNGYKSSYTYDVFGRKKTEIIPYTTASNPQTEIFYSFNGKAPELILKKEKEKTGAGNTFDTYYFYDGFGKLIQTKTDAENNKQIEKNFYYDGLKRVSAVSNPTLVSNSGYYYAPSSSILKTLYARDALSRVVKVTNPDSTSKKITYDRWNVYHYDENGNRIDYELGVDERIQKITEYYGSQKYDTSYGYNADNSIDQILDHKNNLFQFTYDGIGRLTKLYDPDMGIWQYEYDNSGNLVKQTDANGNKVGITYDELNRPTKKEYVGGKQIFSYDLKVKGTLSGVWTPVVSTVYDYDQRLRKTKESKTIDGTTYTTNYIYDAMNRVTDKTIPSGEKISYTYNSQNKLETITGIVNNIDYNELGKVVKILYPNGLSTLLNYDTKMFRLKNIKTGNKQDLNYIYDNVGNIKTITDKTDSSTKTMNYDSLNRMTSAKKTGTNSYSATYSYDAIGNIQSIFMNSDSYNFYYGTKPVHSPSYVLAPKKTGCKYNNPVCGINQLCVDNKCELKTQSGCVPKCSSNYNCVNNNCVLKTGCNYNNPACKSNEQCTNNKCVPKTGTGCQYNNPACGSNYNCVNNNCVLKTGCTYNNPACGSNYNCLNNKCILKIGCTYNNPACNTNFNCVNNQCVPKTGVGCKYNNPSCKSGEYCDMTANVCKKWNNKKLCNYDTECKPEVCCHPKTAVNKAFAPNCASTTCSAGCFPGTTDCGYGTIKCVSNTCQVVMKNLPGCNYLNPACNSNQDCVNNNCVFKTGCQYTNPPCNPNQNCVNNKCILKTGCDYGNPSCKFNEQCINNKCVLGTGCFYNNPPCKSTEKCLNNKCVAGPPASAADLIVYSVKLVNPNQVKKLGDVAVVEAVIQNTGKTTAKNINWELQGKPSNIVFVNSGSTLISEIKPNNFHIVYPQFFYMCSTHMFFSVDTKNTVVETSDTNNYGYISMNLCKGTPSTPSPKIPEQFKEPEYNDWIEPIKDVKYRRVNEDNPREKEIDDIELVDEFEHFFDNKYLNDENFRNEENEIEVIYPQRQQEEVKYVEESKDPWEIYEKAPEIEEQELVIVYDEPEFYWYNPLPDEWFE